MPALSSTMTEGKLVSWVKSEGKQLAEADSVVVVESDKADMDVETFYNSYLTAIIVDEEPTAVQLWPAPGDSPGKQETPVRSQEKGRTSRGFQVNRVKLDLLRTTGSGQKSG
ncbi:hypothetical protein J5N97_011663 [Dioscorea zingiberensis]|uniref:Lipoyl-binding domain-containing protein n=1 Tax=Dioscorea zingiberensis TaxID=325984 RepID=A0A9D5D3H1_9LILI|nr:hypothetical protein J5N97_011663 [Dioscorea zingiberensis]